MIYAKQELNVENVVKYVDQKGFNKDCSLSTFDLVSADKKFNNKLSQDLNKFSGISINDFDMGECLTLNNVQNKVLVNHFWQKNLNYQGHHLDLFVAYDYKKDLLLLIILDNDLNPYLIGNKTDVLINSITGNPLYKNNFSEVDLSKKISFSDLNEKKDLDQDSLEKISESKIVELKYTDPIELEKQTAVVKWDISCKKDRFNGVKSCFMNLNDVMVGIINGRYSVYIGSNHYPGSLSAIKVDSSETIYGYEGLINKPIVVIEQMKKGKIAYTRYKKWPYDLNRDNEVDLSGFTQQFIEMLKRYKSL